MKFGKTFVSHQIPEWTTHYMNYKSLKKVIKTIDSYINYQSFAPLEIPDLISGSLAHFFYELDRDMEKVSQFYNTTHEEYWRRASRIVSLLGCSEDGHNASVAVDTAEELDEIVSILLEMRSVFRNLKWYGELNHKGFVKILKKLDKKLSSVTTLANDQLRHDHPHAADLPTIDLPTHNKENYLDTRVNALPFANGIDLSQRLECINNLLLELGRHQAELAAGAPEAAVIGGLKELHIEQAHAHYVDNKSLQDIYRFIGNDDGAGCVAEIERLNKTQSHKVTARLLLSLLNKATLCNAMDCIDSLFHYTEKCVQERGLDRNTHGPLMDPLEISGRNFYHQHVVSLGKKQLSKEQNQVVPGESSDLSRLYGNQSGPDGIQLAPISIEGLLHVFALMEKYPELHHLLMAKDNYNRTPLHYAAQYGTKDVCKAILEHLQKWRLCDFSESIDDVRVWGDQEGLTPLHLAIIGKHPRTCRNLVSFATQNLTCPNLLLLAARLGCEQIVRDLVDSGIVDINYTDQDNNNETALYISAKSDFVSMVGYLLEKGADPELGESVFGWTPVFAAAAEGSLEVARILKDHGVKYDLSDDSGWLPVEHASLRGHLDVATELTPEDKSLLLYNMDDPSKNTPRTQNASSSAVSATTSPFMNPASEDMLLSTSSIDKLPESNRMAVNEVYRQLKQLDGSSSSVNVAPSLEKSDSYSRSPRNLSRSKSPVNRRRMKPIKSFGHKYLVKDESLVLITLGTTDLRDSSAAVDLNKISMSKSFFTELDTALSLVVTCHMKTTNAVIQTPVVIDLPLEDSHGSATDPLMFNLSDNMQPEDVYVTFDIVPTYQYPSNHNSLGQSKILGRGVAMLESAYTKVGQNFRSLHNEIAVPIIEHNTLEMMGKVRFEYMCVKPFIHPSMSIARSDTYWKQLVSTRVIGHRGLGKNFNNKKSLQLGENTVESFIAAASLGASYVEFDVQLTKDFVPVIYHDFLVAESGGDIPMHMLTAEQFFGLKDQENEAKQKLFGFDKTRQNGNVSKNFALDDELLGKYNRPRSMSSYPSTPNMTTPAEEEELDKEFRDQMARRMKLTKTWKEKGFKGNARGSSIASNFVTLKELFKRLPKNVGFNMELKYPMLDEAEHESMGELAFDMNFYVDTILKVVYDENTSGRDILFSSFHPDICVLLSMKQPTMPILYLTEAGTTQMADIRASSLQNAIRFAKKWNLLGIVSAAETLAKTPRLAQVVKSSGLVCVTYGVQNNDPELCKIQMKAGVDAVIADSVLAVRESLRKEDGKEDSDM